ncbi:MAG: hypothetical protein IT229_02615 [Flavobacteriales bacterium]|nr:hypothetical protein [Flavobacteriales bacterium]
MATQRDLFKFGFFLWAGLWSFTSHGQSTASTELHIYRPKKLLCSALQASVLINDSVEVRLKNREHQVILLPAGPCRLTTGKNILSLTLESGRPAFVRVGYDFNFLFGKLEAVEVTKNFAIAEID